MPSLVKVVLVRPHPVLPAVGIQILWHLAGPQAHEPASQEAVLHEIHRHPFSIHMYGAWV